MKASDAAHLAKASLKSDSELIQPFLTHLWSHHISLAAKKGKFNTEVMMSISFNSQKVVWDADIAKAVSKGLVELGYTINIYSRSESFGSYGDNCSSRAYTVWDIKWSEVKA